MSEISKQPSYAILRNTVTSADTDLNTTTSTWATFLSSYHPSLVTPKSVKIPQYCTTIDIIFDFATADTDTAALSIYAYREGGGAELVCSIDTITAGAMVTDDSRYYADTIATITSAWPTTITESDSAGNNRMAKLTFATRGYRYLMVLFTTIGAGSVRAKYAYL